MHGYQFEMLIEVSLMMEDDQEKMPEEINRFEANVKIVPEKN